MTMNITQGRKQASIIKDSWDTKTYSLWQRKSNIARLGYNTLVQVYQAD